MKVVFENDYEMFQFEKLLDKICTVTDLDKNKFDEDIADLLASLVMKILKADRGIPEKNTNSVKYTSSITETTTEIAKSASVFFDKK